MTEQPAGRCLPEQRLIAIEVACALPERQWVVRLDVAEGTSARAAVGIAAVAEVFPQLDIAGCQLGIFGKPVSDEQLLQAGDRVEVYRPLSNDPRVARRALAARGATMGKVKGRT